MTDESVFRWLDFLVVAASFVFVFILGSYLARGRKDSDKYFLAGRNMPGWVVGFSIMATIVSSMSFLAHPGFSYHENWRYIPGYFGYFVALYLSIALFMPFFRKLQVSSAYEYLEMRFGAWARYYTALGFVLLQVFRTGIILYAVCLPIEAMFGCRIETAIIIFGAFIAIYTILGGLEAVIWGDLIQGIALILGALIVLPVITLNLPGGFGQILHEGYSAGKMSLGSMDLSFAQRGFWVMALGSLFNWCQQACTDQNIIQRYCAPKSKREAKRALLVGAATSIPVWFYFIFIGTALWVFYQQFPDPHVDEMVPEQILPFFILTQIPVGLAGFVIAGIMAAAMSTINSSINSTASTVTYDFYRRLINPNADKMHYAKAGRIVSTLLSAVMIGLALFIHLYRGETLNDLQNVMIYIFGSGLLGIFLLGFLTRKVGNTAVFTSMIVTVVLVIFWLLLSSHAFAQRYPDIAARVPDLFWLPVHSNLFLMALAYCLGLFIKDKREKVLDNLTIWTAHKDTSNN